MTEMLIVHFEHRMPHRNDTNCHNNFYKTNNPRSSKEVNIILTGGGGGSANGAGRFPYRSHLPDSFLLAALFFLPLAFFSALPRTLILSLKFLLLFL